MSGHKTVIAKMSPLHRSHCSLRLLAVVLMASLVMAWSQAVAAADRTISIQPTIVQAGETNYVKVLLNGLGDENALGFTLTFDPLVLKFVEVRLGGEAAFLQVNSSSAPDGKIGVVIAKTVPETFPAAGFTLVELGLAALAGTEGTTRAIGFSDEVVFRETADAQANTLLTTYTVGNVAVNSTPTLAPIASVSSAEDLPVSIAITVGDAQTAPGDLLLTAASDNPAIVPSTALTLGGTGSNRFLQFTPATNQFGAVNITVSLTDGVFIATKTFTVTITAVNDAPTAGPDTLAASEDTLNIYPSANLVANDAPGPANEAGQALTITSVSPASAQGGVVSLVSGSIHYRPATNFFGADSFTYTVADNGATDGNADPRTATGVVTVNVARVNAAPVFNPVAAQTIPELASFTLNVSAVDPDGEPVTYSLGAGAPAGASVHPTTGVFTWTPSEAQGPGTHTINFVASDGNIPSLNGTVSLTVNVQEMNSAPTTTIATGQRVSEGALVSVLIPAVDTDLPANALGFSLTGSSKGSVNPVTGLFTWQTSEADGPSTNEIMVVITDNGSPTLTVTNIFSVIVDEVNNAPTLAALENTSVIEHEPLIITAVATDSDLPPNALTFSLATAPAGMSIHPTTGVIQWTPSEAQAPGAHSVTVKVTDDGSGQLSATRSFIVTALETNSAPVVTVADQTLVEGEPLVFTVGVVDADLPANSFSYSLANAPAGMTINGAGRISFTLSELQGGTAPTVTVQVTDNGVPALTGLASFKVTILETNSAPTLGLSSQTIPEGAPWTYDIPAADTDLPANALTFTLQNAPAGMSLANGQLIWTPTEAQGPGSYTVTITVQDNGVPAKSASGQLTIQVTEVNSRPVTTDLTIQQANEGAQIVAQIPASDNDLPANTLSYSLKTGSPGSVNAATGEFSWQTSEIDGPSTNEISVIITDNGALPLATTNTFLVIIDEVNSAPALALIPDAAIAEHQTLTIQANASDTDIPANQLSFELVTAPAGMSITSTGRIQWTPGEADGPGVHLVTVKVTDDSPTALSATRSFSVTVAETNAAPTIAAISDKVAVEGGLLSFTASAADFDLPAQTLSFRLENAPAGMLVSPTGVITFTPSELQGGLAPLVSLVVTDNGSPARSASASFRVTILETNSAPTLAPINQTISEGALWTYIIPVSDSDVPANTVTLRLQNAPDGLTLENGQLRWRPTEAQGPGAYTVTIIAEDNGSPPKSSTAQLVLTVTEANQPPQLALANQTVAEGSTLIYTPTVEDADRPANRLSFRLDNAPSGMSLIEAGTITWTPSEEQGPAEFMVQLTVTDDGSPPESVSGEFRVTVTEVNLPPAFGVIPPQVIPEKTLFSLEIPVTDPDVPAQAVTIQLGANAPAGMSVDSPTKTLTWIPSEEQGPGVYTVTLTATDASAASATTSFTIEALDINDPPELALPGTQVIEAGAPKLVEPIVVADPDAGATPILVALATTGGSIRISSTNGLVILEGSLSQPGTNLIFEASIADANAALASVTFVPLLNFEGESALAIVVSDLGATGSGEPQEVGGSVAFLRQGSNTPPSITGPELQLVPEGTRASFAVDVGDVETASDMLVVTATARNLTLIPNTAVQLSGAGARRVVTFTPAAGLVGSTELVVRVRDAAGIVAEVVVPITVHPVPPLVAVHPPARLTLIEGATLALDPLVSSTPVLRYQWLHNESAIPGATQSMLGISAIAEQQEGLYRLRIQNSAGVAFTTATEVEVLVPPGIVAQPPPRILGEGAPLILSVAARGDGPLTYQWFKNSAPLEGATHPTLQITNVTEADEGAYQVEVHNSFASALSNPAQVVVEQAPRISSNPADISVIEGNSAALTVIAFGTQPLRYQWSRNNEDLLGGTNATFSIPLVRTNDAGAYRVRISNDHGTILSEPAALAVLLPVRITLAPVSQTRAVGQDATLTTLAQGSAPLAYQWLRNNEVVPGQTNASLTLRGVGLIDAGDYRVRVSNPAGRQESSSATLTVVAPPTVAIDGGASRTLLTGENLTIRAIVSGTEPLTHQWLKNGAPIPGAGTRLLPLFNVLTNDTGAYTLVVTNLAGSASATVNVSVHAPAVITSEPADLTVRAGDPASFQVGAAGSAPFSHQWFFNGLAITNATNASLSIASAQLAQDGKYKVRVSNPAGIVRESREAQLTVAVAPVVTRQPVSQTALAGSSIFLEVVISGTRSSFQWFRNNVALPGETNSTLIIPALSASSAGSHHLVVSNFAGAAQSQPAQISLLQPVEIVSHPVSASILAGQPHELSVAVSGSEPISYQWLRNGQPIAGATARVLTIANPQNAADRTDSGDYAVRVQNSAATVISEPAEIFVVTPVSFIFDPASVEVMEGSDTFLFALAAGSDPISYQWRRNGAALEGETNSILYLTAVTPQMAGDYDVVAANDLSSLASGVAVVTALEKPRIAALPFETFVAVGEDTTLAANATGAPPLSYQWTLNGAPIPGATNASLTLTNAQPVSSGAYGVVVANRGGAAVSNPSVVLVAAPTIDLRDNLADALSLDLPSATLRGDNFQASAELGEEHVLGIAARRSVWFTWQAPSSGIATFSTAGSSFDTTLAIYRGPRGTTSAMPRVGVDEDSGPYLTSELSFNAVGGELYHVAIDGFNGAEGHALISWTLTPAPIALPRILERPLTYVGLENSSHEFFVVAESPDGRELGYEWFFNNAPLANATNSSLLLNPIEASKVGSYRVVVRNGVETGQPNLPSVSLAAQLQLTTELSLVGNIPTAEDKITFTNNPAGPLRIGSKLIQQLATVARGYSGAQVFSTTDAVRDPSEPQHCGVVGGASSWWLYTPPSSGVVRISTAGSSFDTVLAVYTVSALNFESLVSVTCDNDSGPDKTSVVTFSGQANQTYFVVVDGVNGARGTVRLGYELAGVPQIVEDLGAAPLSGAGDLQALARFPVVQQSVPEGGSFTLRVVATNIIGSAPLSYQWKANGVLIPGATASSFALTNMTAARAGDYQVLVSNFAGAVSSRIVRLSLSSPVAIQTPPQNASVPAGANATFTVVATGPGPITHQWIFEGALIPGATNASLTIPNAQAAHAGSYTVEVRNPFGAASASASLTILGAPVITRQPSAGPVVAGGAATLSVEATGSQPLAYQWRFKGVNLPGQTNPTLTLANIQPQSAGEYTVVVSNIVRSVISDTVQLTVNVPVTIVDEPASQSVLVNQNASFAVNARGASPITYQWLLNGAPLPGQTSPILSLTRVQAAQQGQYSVRVANVVNEVVTAPANLSVLTPPVITQQPANLSVQAGATANFVVVASGSGTLRHQWRFNGADIPGATSSVLSLPSVSAASAGAYSVAIANEAVTVVSATAQLSVTEPPVITQQPEGRSVLAGNTVSLQVTATGTGVLRHQWLRNELPLAGQTNGALVLPNLQPSADGNYQVIVSNSGGAVTSIVAVVRALVAPAITQQPLPQSAAAGQSVTFTVGATGSAPLRFQWRLNGAPISGATNATLNIPSTALSSAGNYSALVSNEAGVVSSANAALTVASAPVIVQQPQPRTVTIGSGASFTVAAFGVQPLQYQWFLNGSLLNNATNSTFAVNNVQQIHAGNYTVRVSNSAGSRLSAPAALAIGEPPVTVRTTDAAFLLNGSFRLKISGPPTGTFQLLASPDLLTWELVTTLTFVNGLYEFDDTTASQRDGRFYRIVPAP